ncbi:MAG: methyltransferase domain-containing protein [Patescibacteria group bacterium]
MNTHIFVVGRHPELSLAEIKSVFSILGISHTIEKAEKQTLVIATAEELDTGTLMKRLGGTIKIGQRLLSSGSIEETILRHLAAVQIGKIVFSITGQNDRAIALRLKKELKSQGRSARYIESKNTATILHNQLVEHQGDITIIDGAVFVTKAIQPIESLGERDFGRPYRDAKSGMLPPKLAMMMINLAGQSLGATILDPFCGSGTILMEAATIGYTNLMGSDISPKAIDDTRQNFAWQGGSLPKKLFVADARKISAFLPKDSVDAIITEPYLGKPLRGSEPESVLASQTKELARLYHDCFIELDKILRPGGAVVIIIPAFQSKTDWIKINVAFPWTKTVSFFYARPGQRVGREIVVLKKLSA